MTFRDEKYNCLLVAHAQEITQILMNEENIQKGVVKIPTKPQLHCSLV